MHIASQVGENQRRLVSEERIKTERLLCWSPCLYQLHHCVSHLALSESDRRGLCCYALMKQQHLFKIQTLSSIIQGDHNQAELITHPVLARCGSRNKLAASRGQTDTQNLITECHCKARRPAACPSGSVDYQCGTAPPANSPIEWSC